MIKQTAWQAFCARVSDGLTLVAGFGFGKEMRKNACARLCAFMALWVQSIGHLSGKKEKSLDNQGIFLVIGGEEGIRTLDTL